MVGAAGSVSSLILSGLLKILINCDRIFKPRPGYIFRSLTEEKVEVSAGILSVHTHYIYISDPSDINKNLLVIQIQKHVKFCWA